MVNCFNPCRDFLNKPALTHERFETHRAAIYRQPLLVLSKSMIWSGRSSPTGCRDSKFRPSKRAAVACRSRSLPLQQRHAGCGRLQIADLRLQQRHAGCGRLQIVGSPPPAWARGLRSPACSRISCSRLSTCAAKTSTLVPGLCFRSRKPGAQLMNLEARGVGALIYRIKLNLCRGQLRFQEFDGLPKFFR